MNTHEMHYQFTVPTRKTTKHQCSKQRRFVSLGKIRGSPSLKQEKETQPTEAGDEQSVWKERGEKGT